MIVLYTVSIMRISANVSGLMRLFLGALIVSLVVCAGLGIGFILFESWGETQFKILSTASVLGIYSLMGLADSVILKKSNLRPFAYVAIATTIFTFLRATAMTWFSEWFNLRDANTLKISISLWLISFSFAHISLLLTVVTKTRVVLFTQLATIVSVILVAGQVLYLIYTDACLSNPEAFFKAMGVFGILDAVGTIVTPLLNRVVKKR